MNLAASLALFATLGIASDVPVKTTRASMVTLERSFDRQIEHMSIDDPVLLLGPTRSMYLSGFGAVFSTEVNLVANAAISPFHLTYSKEELARLKAKKQERVGILKNHMREMLVSTASALDNIPPDEQVVLGVNVFYYSWEDSNGLPRQIIMRASRKALTRVPRTDLAALAAAIHTEEY